MKRTIFLTVFCLIFFNLLSHDNSSKPAKIVGYMQVRNEENIIEQSLRALSLFVDAIVILDDASTDNTRFILEVLKEELPIERIMYNKESVWEKQLESDNLQKLLEAGREIDGTHFILIDADELFSSNCLDNNMLRKEILQLRSGESIRIKFVNFWRSTTHYRCDGSPYAVSACTRIFCDHPTASYQDSFLHGSRLPAPLSGKVKYLPPQYALMHFQFVNWQNLLIKQAWYRCLEHVHSPEKSIALINATYAASKDERGLKLQEAPQEWFLFYPFFDENVYDKPVLWRKQQVLNWFGQFGKDYFKDVDIWDVNWED